MNDVSRGVNSALDAGDEFQHDVDRGNSNGDGLAETESFGSSQQQREGFVDRRKPSLKSFVYGAFNPRRRRVRRTADTDQTFLDWHPTHLLTISAVFFVLSLIDGLLTVHLVAHGATEFSEVIAFLGSDSPVIFALVKFFVIATLVVVLVLTAHMRIFRSLKGSTVLYLFMAAYLTMLLWQLSLARAIS